MSLMLKLVAKNLPLYNWRQYEGREDELSGVWLGLDAGGKKIDKIVNTIVNGLSHPEVITLLVEEFEILPPLIRMALTDTCNKAHGVRSGNKTKGIAEANQRLSGRLLRAEKYVRTVERRREGRDGVFYDRRTVNPAVAGAQRKYVATALPENFGSLPRKEQKLIRKELTNVRRKG